MTNIKLINGCAFEKASFAVLYRVVRDNNEHLSREFFEFIEFISTVFEIQSYLDEVYDQPGFPHGDLILIQEIEIDGYKVAQFKDYFGEIWWTASYEIVR